MSVEWIVAAMAGWATRRPWRTVAVAAGLMVLALGLAAAGLRLRTSNLDLIDPEVPAVARFLRVTEAFGTPNVLVVVLGGAEREVLGAASDRIAAKLRQLPEVRIVANRAGDGLLEPAHMGNRDGTSAYLFVQPTDGRAQLATIEPFLAAVRDGIDAAAIPAAVTVGFTGMPQYALDDRAVISRDVARYTAVSVVAVVIVFVSLVGGWGAAWPVLGVLGWAVAMTLGGAAIIPGHLTLLSASFGSILFGLGVDFGIHVVRRTGECLESGMPLPEAAVAGCVRSSRGLVTGALTTAAVFGGMWFSGFRGFSELGVIAAFGVVTALVGALTLLPALLCLRGKQIPGRRDAAVGRWLARFANSWVVTGIATVVFTLAACGGTPQFDANYLSLQPRASETARLEREMIDNSDYSTQFAVFVRADRIAAADLAAELRDEPTVAGVKSIVDVGSLLPPPGQGGLPDPNLAALQPIFENEQGECAVYAYPKGNPWNPIVQREFVAAMRKVDAEVTGMPVLGAYMIQQSAVALRRTGMLGAIVLVVLVGLDFRRLLPTILALLPTAVTAVGMLGGMHWLGIHFNPLNVMALPLVLGIAVDDGVHVVHRYLQENGDLSATLAGTGRSVLATSLTTLAAFGALGLTSHRGLQSFIFATCIGVAAAMVASLLLLPPLLQALRDWLRPQLSQPLCRRSISPTTSMENCHENS